MRFGVNAWGKWAWLPFIHLLGVYYVPRSVPSTSSELSLL